MADLTWDDLDDFEEEITEEAIKTAETSGRVPVGLYLCQCIGSNPKQQDFNEYSCIAANLQWEIKKVLELNGIPAVEGESDAYVGRSIFDLVNQAPTGKYADKEKDGMKNRRTLFAKRTGLITDSGGKVTKAMMRTEIIGRYAIINYIQDSDWEDKDGKTRQGKRKVAFDGYESADGMNVTDQTPDIDDI